MTLYECHTNVSHATVLRKDVNNSRLSGEKIKLNDIRTNVLRHTHKCLVSFIRMKMKLKLHLWERCDTLLRMSLDYRTYRAIAQVTFSKLNRNSQICHINVHSVRLQCKSCVSVVNFCCEIVANKSRNSLQLSHSSKIGA